MLRIRNCIVDRDFLIQDLNLDFRRMRTDAWELDGGRAAPEQRRSGMVRLRGCCFYCFCLEAARRQVPPGCERYMA
jgi:hypothetical protein